MFGSCFACSMTDPTGPPPVRLYGKIDESTRGWTALDPRWTRKPRGGGGGGGAGLQLSHKARAALVDKLVRVAGGTGASPVGLWVATEKVHGANFAFVCSPDGRDVRPAKRTALLEAHDPFFGYRAAFAAAAPIVGALAASLAAGDPSVALVTVFAELYGGTGGGAGASVPEGLEEPLTDGHGWDGGASISSEPEAVQTEITYRPSHGFYLFDAAVTRRRKDDGAVSQAYVDYLALCEPFCTACSAAPDLLAWAAPLALGSLDEMCALPLDFKSPLSKGDVGEGLVVRPVCEVAPAGPGSRALLKRKAGRFLERVRGGDEGGPGAGASLLEILSSRIVPARVTSVRSKAGARGSRAALAAAVVEDALNDARLDPEDPGTWAAWSALPERDKAALSTVLLERATALVGSR